MRIRRSGRWKLFLFFAVLSGLSSRVAFAAPQAVLKIATITDDTIVFREPKDSSERLGRLRKGTVLKVYFPELNGWYATYFPKPVKGSVYGWIHAEFVAIQQENLSAVPSAASAHPASQPTSALAPGTHWISFAGGMHLVGPADLQNAIGLAPGSVTGTALSLEYGQKLGSSWAGWLRAGSNSMSSSVSGTNASYSVSSLSLIAGAGVALVHGASSWLSADLGIGIGLCTAGDTVSAARSVSTSSVMTVPILMKGTYRYQFHGKWALGGEAGLRIESLGTVPMLVFPTGTTSVQAPVSLTGPFGSASISYLF